MKKIISVITVLVMLCFSSIHVFAKDCAQLETDLKKLCEGIGGMYSYYPRTIITYENETYYAYTDAVNYLENNEQKTRLQLQLHFDRIANSFKDRYIYPTYAFDTLQNAKKILNYNNWYDEEDWSAFQSCIDNLEKIFEGKEQIDNYDPELDIKEVSKAFYSLLKSYNYMTNKNALKGDVNGDGQVSIADVTLIQKYLAESEKFTGGQIMRAKLTKTDVYTSSNFYERITIDDATALQNFLADNITEFPVNYTFIDEFDSVLGKDYVMSHFMNFTLCSRFLDSNTYFTEGEGVYIGMYYDYIMKNY